MGDFAPVDNPFKGKSTAPIKKRVTYMQDWDIGDFAYDIEHEHPMKPQRVRLTHSLVMNYQLHKKMEVYVSFSPPLLIQETRALTISSEQSQHASSI